MRNFYLPLLLALAGLTVKAQNTLLPYSSTWKYKDNGSDQGTAWRASAFNDITWASGAAELGYGDGDETTIVSYGSNPNKKHITTYFRKTFSVSTPSQYNSFTLNLLRDDGAIVYLNGAEVYRTNMSNGNVNYKTKATADAADDGNTPQTTTLPAGSLLEGDNVIAVEIHQSATNSSDITFSLELIGNSGQASATLTRGPYLNMGNESAVTVRWRTNTATDSRIEVGTVHGTYTLSATNPASVTEHEVRITGLDADTKYFYSFGSSTQVLQSGSDNFFITAPPANTTRKMRFAAFGDCGRNDNGFQAGTLSAYQNVTGANPAEVMLLLGDNAYDNGLDAEYQSRYFNTYSASILKNHQLFPAPGNHDYANNSSRQADHNIPYYSIFTNPANGECGGVISGTEAYYSWNWGNVHFLSLDSYGKEDAGTTRLYDTTGAQAVWVKQDLAANTKPWVIAYWHHPPYTMGSHNSDTETELINMRQKFALILERLGVDLIICGHSHDYERSYLLNGHYGNESTFNLAAHAKSNSSAAYNASNNSCPYTTVNGEMNKGTVYVVAGSAGADGGVQPGYPHNALPFSVDDGGMLYFEIEDNRMDAKFIRRDGVIADGFTIMKNVNNTNDISVPTGTPVQLTASWLGNYLWSTGETTRSITVTPQSNVSYSVTDGSLTCLDDIYNITVTGLRAPVINTIAEQDGNFKLRPTLVSRGQAVQVLGPSSGKYKVSLYDVNGREVGIYRFSGNGTIETQSLHPGVYFVKWNLQKGSKTYSFVVTE
jgi:acid phosphatase type 7